MLIIRKHANAMLVVTKDYKPHGGKHDKNLAPGVVRLNPTITELKADKFPALCEHPDFQDAVDRGEFEFVTADDVLDNYPRAGRAARPAAAPKPKGKGKGKKGAATEAVAEPPKVSSGSAPDMAVVNTWPKLLKDVPNLLDYIERTAIKIVDNVIDVDTLKKWMEAEKGQDKERRLVIERLDKQIGKITGIDNSRRSRARV